MSIAFDFATIINLRKRSHKICQVLRKESEKALGQEKKMPSLHFRATCLPCSVDRSPGVGAVRAGPLARTAPTDQASIILLTLIHEEVSGHGQQFAHHGHQSRARLSTALHQTLRRDAKGRILPMNAAQSSHVEDTSRAGPLPCLESLALPIL
jgi:hypothetical protein